MKFSFSQFAKRDRDLGWYCLTSVNIEIDSNC